MKEQEEKSQSTKDQQPDRLNSRHRALMRKLASGFKLQDAADELGYTLVRASVIVNSPLFKAELEKMQAAINAGFVEAEATKDRDDTRIALMASREKAAKTLDGALDDESASIRVSAAKDILDRTGYAKEDKLKAKILVEPSPALINVIDRIIRDKDANKNDTKPD